MNAGTYVRISKARDGSTLGIERQQPPCEDLIRRKGWTAAELYIDNDISAYSRKRRPAYERMLADAKAGRIDVIVAWHADRLTRQPIENEYLIDLAESHGLQLATATGEHDLATASGRLMFRQLGILSRYESEHRAERLKLKHEELAKAGKPHGGGHRLFGFTRDRQAVIAEEEAIVQQAAAALLRGQSVRSVASWMSTVSTTTTGRSWSTATVRQLMKTPALAALRRYQGEIIGSASHPAILDVETWQAVNALLRDPERVHRGRRVTYLLKGLAVCGRCGTQPMLKSHPQQGKNRYRAYACLPVPGLEGGCGLSVVAAPVEILIEERVLDRLAGPGLRRALAQRSPSGRDVTAKLAAIDAKLDEIGRLWDDDMIDTPEYLRRRAVQDGRRAKLEAERRSGLDQAVLAELPREADALRRWWVDADVETRRNVVRAVIARVVVNPAAKRGGRFDPSRVPPGNVEWKA